MIPMVWVDSEVHLFPPKWCHPDYYPPVQESILRQVIYDHPEGKIALSRASVEGVLAEMEVSRINRAIIMGLPWRNPAMCWENNRYITEVVQRYSTYFFGFGVLPPLDTENPRDAVRRMAEEYNFKGVKVIPSWQGYRLDDHAFEPVIEEIIARDLILMPHTDHLFVAPDQADTAYSLYKVARSYPELKILAPHLGGLLCLYALHTPVKPALKNMLFITTVPTTMKMILFALEAVGAEQLAFGTDFPFNPSHDQHTPRHAFEALPLSDEEKRLIAGQNVLRFLGEST